MKLNWPIRHETICSGLSWWGAREGDLNQGWTRRSWLDSCTLRERSRAEQRSQSKANKNVAIISENLLHSIALLCSNILVRPAQRRSYILSSCIFNFTPSSSFTPLQDIISSWIQICEVYFFYLDIYFPPNSSDAKQSIDPT